MSVPNFPVHKRMHNESKWPTTEVSRRLSSDSPRKESDDIETIRYQSFAEINKDIPNLLIQLGDMVKYYPTTKPITSQFLT